MTRRLQRAVVAVLTVCAVVLGTAVHAEASTYWSIDDGFEGTASLWNADGGGPLDCPVYRTCNPAEVYDNAAETFNGTSYASIQNTSGYGANWLSFGRRVRIAAGSTQCGMGAWIKVDYARIAPVTFNLEVIRVRDWTYEAVKTFKVTDLTQVGVWRFYSVGSWYPGPRDVYIRFVLIGQERSVVGIHVDDAGVSCKVG